MGQEFIIYDYSEISYKINKSIVEKLTSLGIDLNDEYFQYILVNNSPIYPQNIERLIEMDVYNRLYVGSNGKLGRIVKLDNSGLFELDYFETIFDATLDSLHSHSLNKYSFEYLHNKGVFFYGQEYDFFGLRINSNPIGKEFDIIRELTTYIRQCKNIFLRKNRIYNDWYKKFKNELSYEEFALQCIRYKTFMYAEVLDFQLTPNKHQPCIYTKHIVENCNDYEDRLRYLFKKYSIQSQTAFKQVFNLNEVRGAKGIYLLCLPQIKGCYVGKTEKCFSTRIPKHFTTRNSEFDKQYTPADIKEIYVLELEETLILIDKIEEDCIATLGSQICLNALSGGYSLELIKSDKYCENEHFLAADTLQWITEDSLNAVQFRKNT